MRNQAWLRWTHNPTRWGLEIFGLRKISRLTSHVAGPNSREAHFGKDRSGGQEGMSGWRRKVSLQTAVACRLSKRLLNAFEVRIRLYRSIGWRCSKICIRDISRGHQGILTNIRELQILIQEEGQRWSRVLGVFGYSFGFGFWAHAGCSQPRSFLYYAFKGKQRGRETNAPRIGSDWSEHVGRPGNPYISLRRSLSPRAQKGKSERSNTENSYARWERDWNSSSSEHPIVGVSYNAEWSVSWMQWAKSIGEGTL